MSTTEQAYFDEPGREKPVQFIGAVFDLRRRSDDELLDILNQNTAAMARYAGLGLTEDSGLWKEALREWRACRGILNRRVGFN